MNRNSTLILWNYLLEKENISFDNLIYPDDTTVLLKPNKEIINKVLAYAKSVHAIKTKSGERILVNLN